MKLEILQEELLRGLGIVLRAVSTRAQLPVLSAVKIEADHNEIVLSATDLEIGIRQTISAKVEKGGVVAIPAKTFSELLSTLSPGRLSIELKEQSLVIKSGGFKGKILTVPANDFPKLPDFESSLMELSAMTLAEGVGRVSFASAKDSLRPVLTGVLIEVSQTLRMVATDGFRLAVATLPIKGTTVTDPQSFLVPARALYEASRILKEGVVAISYLPDSRQVLFKGGQTLFITQIIEGSFPDYNKILPKEFVVEVVVAREELLSAVKTSMVFARDNSNMMRWSVGQNKIVMTASSSSSGEGEMVVECKSEGESLEVVFNARYVMDYLTLGSSESVWIGLGGKLAPGMLAESDTVRDKAFYVVMPINA